MPMFVIQLYKLSNVSVSIFLLWLSFIVFSSNS